MSAASIVQLILFNECSYVNCHCMFNTYVVSVLLLSDATLSCRVLGHVHSCNWTLYNI